MEDARQVRGMRDPLDLEERLASLMSDSIQPRIVPDLEILPWRRTHILAVQVHPSPSRPHFLKREGLEGGVYVRVDSTIVFRAASESFAPVRKLTRHDLENLRLMTRHQGRKVPTVGGMLLFGKDRERHFPNAWIQAGRFGGTDNTHIMDQAQIRQH